MRTPLQKSDAAACKRHSTEAPGSAIASAKIKAPQRPSDLDEAAVLQLHLRHIRESSYLPAPVDHFRVH